MNKLISNKIKYLYIVFTLGMVMYHSKFCDNLNIVYFGDMDRFIFNIYSWFADHIGYVTMSFFFFMSAFWFYRDLDNYNQLFNKLKKKIHTLLIPFLIWSLIIGIYKYHFGHIDDCLTRWFYYLFESPVVGPLWYILALLILQLFSPIVLLLKKNNKVFITFSFLICIYLIFRSFGIVPKFLSFNDWWWYENLVSYTLVYYIGILFAVYGSKYILDVEYNEKKYTIIGSIILVFSLIINYFYGNNIKVLAFIIDLFEIIGLWFILKPNLFKKKVTNFFDCSFYVFALHNGVLIPIFDLFFKHFLYSFSFSGIVVIFIKLFEVLVIYVICAVCRFFASFTFSDKVNYYLTGGR